MPLNIQPEVNFCRRCGSKLTRQKSYHHYRCEKGHEIFVNASPAAGIILVNSKEEVLLLVRAQEPSKGTLTIPGGFADGAEPLEEAAIREVKEETGLLPGDYSSPEYVLNGIEDYELAGEHLPVLVVVFSARLRKDKSIVLDGDSSSAVWMPIHKVDPQSIAFPVVSAALRSLQQR